MDNKKKAKSQNQNIGKKSIYQQLLIAVTKMVGKLWEQDAKIVKLEKQLNELNAGFVKPSEMFKLLKDQVENYE